MEFEDGVGQQRPNRSDARENLTEEEKAQYAQQLQEFLTGTTPVRALKPSRSENLDASALLDSLPVPRDLSKAELELLKKLEASGEVLLTDGGPVNDDSYVVTPYYDELNKVDKTLHHRTGSGFIAGEPSSSSFKVGEDGQKIVRTSSHTNPGTNEWQPAPPQDSPIESKVHRSDPLA